MTEIAAVAGLLACTSMLIGAGVTIGTRYIDRAVRVSDSADARKTPLVRPSHPSGSAWQADAA